MKKTPSKSVKVAISAQQILATGLVTFQIGKTYRTIKSIAKEFCADVPIRRGFGYIDSAAAKHKVAVWCISIANNTPWVNTLKNGDTIIEERKRAGESPHAFQARVRKTEYDVDTYRLTFVKEKRTYRFVGVFRVVAFDMKNATAVFEKVACPSLIFWIKRETRKKITITIEEETTVMVAI